MILCYNGFIFFRRWNEELKRAKERNVKPNFKKAFALTYLRHFMISGIFALLYVRKFHAIYIAMHNYI